MSCSLVVVTEVSSAVLVRQLYLHYPKRTYVPNHSLLPVATAEVFMEISEHIYTFMYEGPL
jgi:hypothetical protein